MVTDLRLRCRVEVLEVGEIDFLVGVRWVESSGQVQVPLLGPVEFDSGAESDVRGIVGSIREPWLRLVGTEYRARIDFLGVIQELPDNARDRERAWRNVSEGPNPRMVAGLLERRALRHQLNLLFPVYPAEEVVRGDCWEVTVRESVGNHRPEELMGEAKCVLLAEHDSVRTLQVSTTDLVWEEEPVDRGSRCQALVVDSQTGALVRQRVECAVRRHERRLLGGSVASTLRFRTLVNRVEPNP